MNEMYILISCYLMRLYVIENLNTVIVVSTDLLTDRSYVQFIFRCNKLYIGWLVSLSNVCILIEHCSI